jgi:hypothetical protein
MFGLCLSLWIQQRKKFRQVCLRICHHILHRGEGLRHSQSLSKIRDPTNQLNRRGKDLRKVPFLVLYGCRFRHWQQLI